MTHMEHSRALRAREDIHFNCFQSVVVPYAKELNLTEDQAYALGAHFGGGVRHGSICGALSGAMMVMGGLGYDEKAATEFLRAFIEKHGSSACAQLLKDSRERGEEKKPHCDSLVFEMIEALEALPPKG